MIVSCSVVVVLVICVITVVALAANSGKGSNTAAATATSAPVVHATATPAGPTATAKPTATATAKPTWQTIQSFSGNGNKKTGFFDVPVNWRIVWTCDPSSFSLGQYNVIVEVKDTNANLLDLAINTICQNGNTSGSTDEHVGGQQVYLDITSEGTWQIDVQVLK